MQSIAKRTLLAVIAAKSLIQLQPARLVATEKQFRMRIVPRDAINKRREVASTDMPLRPCQSDI